MWFAFVAVGLALVIAGGTYVQRRLATSLGELGVGPRPIRIMRWVSRWLLYAFPVMVIVSIAVSVGLGRATMPRFDGPIAAWLLGVPFLWAVLVVVQSLPWLLVIDLVYVMRRRHARAPRWRAIATVAAVGAFALYTPIRVIAERGALRVRHHEVGTGTGAPFRIAFVADLQQDAHTDGDAMIAAVNANQLDVVLSGGDWINSSADYNDAAASSAAALRSRLGTFTVLGDHEHFAYFDRERSVREIEAAMAARGVAMLDNQIRMFEHAGKRIGVAFLNYNYVTRTPAPQVQALIAQLAGADYKIVVTHQLDDKLAAQLEDRVDLVLGAHTHGGQINPVIGVVHVPLARLETRHIDGRYQLGTTTVIVTAGIGYSLVPIRYAAPGSLEIIELRP
jgi:predicted MPP superfamily phosphohydrolase